MAKIKKQTKKQFAVFDIDGTIFRSSLLIEMVDGLIAAGIFPKKAEKEYKKEYYKWLDREGSYEDYLKRVIGINLKYIAGKKEADVEKITSQVVSFYKNRVYRFTRDLLKQLKGKYYLLAISGSPFQAVREFGEYLGFDKVYGRIHEVNEKGIFTGNALYEDIISDKKKILSRAVEKENLTFKKSIGVGDTEIDVSFLKMVSRPIVFNPNEKLLKIAKKNGWEIVVERKDVIYHWKPRKNKKGFIFRA